MAQAGPEMQAKLLEGLGLKGYLITDGHVPSPTPPPLPLPRSVGALHVRNLWRQLSFLHRLEKVVLHCLQPYCKAAVCLRSPVPGQLPWFPLFKTPYKDGPSLLGGVRGLW